MQREQLEAEAERQLHELTLQVNQLTKTVSDKDGQIHTLQEVFLPLHVSRILHPVSPPHPPSSTPSPTGILYPVSRFPLKIKRPLGGGGGLLETPLPSRRTPHPPLPSHWGGRKEKSVWHPSAKNSLLANHPRAKFKNLLEGEGGLTPTTHPRRHPPSPHPPP